MSAGILESNDETNPLVGQIIIGVITGLIVAAILTFFRRGWK